MTMKKFFAWLMVLALAAPALAVQLVPLSLPEMAAKDATHVATVTWADFTEDTANTAETFSLAIPAGTAVEMVAMVLDEAFNASVGDTNHTGSVLLEVGDGSDADLFLTSTELNADGTEVFIKLGPLGSVAGGATTANVLHTPVLTPTAANVLHTPVLTPTTVDVLHTPVLTPTTVDVLHTPVLTVTTQEITWDSDGSGTMLTNTFVTGVTVASTTNAVLSGVSVASTTNAVLSGVSVASTTTAVLTAVSVASTTTAVVTAVSPTVSELGRKLYASAGNVVLTFTPNADDDLMDNTAGQVRIFLRLHDRK
jgi:hypothetical protein